MNAVKGFMKRNWLYLAAFAIPAGVMLLSCLLRNTWPFGSGMILRGDMSYQFVPFYYELWEKVHNGGAFSYTWNIAGGCDFNLILGYLMSPFTLLVLIFPKRYIADTVQFIMVLKWILVSVSMVYFFYHTKHNTLTKHKKAVSLFLGLAFGMGNGMINFMGYIQFTEVMIWFPFLLLLVEKIVSEKKWKLYYLILTYCIFVQYYLMFGICIILFVWFVLQFNKDTKEKRKKFFIFAGSSVLSACTCIGSMLLNLKLSSGRLESEGESLRLSYIKSIMMSPVDFIKQLFIFEPIPDQSSREPNIYFTVLCAFMVLFFIFIKISKKRKCCMIGMSLLLAASYFFGFLNLIWHCFTVPNGVNYRFTNLFVFMMLILVLYVLVHLEDLKIYHVLIVGVIEITAFVFAFLNIQNYNSVFVYLVTILLIALYIMLFILFCRKSITYSNMLLTIVVFGILELGTNAYSALEDYAFDISFFSEEGDGAKIAGLSEKMDLESGERVNYNVNFYNMGMLTSENTDSAFMSGINNDNQELHLRLGMGNIGLNVYYLSGASPLINLIYNTRYGVGSSYMEFSDAQAVEGEDWQLYEMQRLAGMGYMVRSSVLDWGNSGAVCFDLQNEFVEMAAGGDAIFHSLLPEGLSCQSAIGSKVEPMEGVEDGWYYYVYNNQFGNEYDTLHVEFTADRDIEDLYWFGNGNTNAVYSVFIDDEIQYEESQPRNQSTVHIGKIKKGQKVEIYAVPDDAQKGEDTVWSMQFAEFDEAAYAKAYESLSRNVYEIETFEDDYIKGSIHADEDGIMMTSIQASEGFEVFVDGEKTEYETVADVMIGVPLAAGDHVVEFKYHTPRVLAADVISICSFGVFILLCILERRKKTFPAEQAQAIDE